MNYFLIFFGVIILCALVNYLIVNVKREEEKLENIDNKNTKPKAEYSSKKHPSDNLEQFKEAINGRDVINVVVLIGFAELIG